MKTYQYDELNEAGKLRAIGDVLQFWMECDSEELPEFAVRKFFEVVKLSQRYNQTDVLPGLVAIHCRQELVQHCREMLFLEDGEFYTFKEFAKYLKESAK